MFTTVIIIKILIILLKLILLIFVFNYSSLLIGYTKLRTNKCNLIPRPLKIKINFKCIHINISTILYINSQ